MSARLLRVHGIGIARSIGVPETVRGVPLRVCAASDVAEGAAMALFPDSALWTVNTVMDLDSSGLLPQPAEFAEVLQGQLGELDTLYLAHFLSLQSLLGQRTWHAERVREHLGRSAGTADEERIAQVHALLRSHVVTAPLAVWAAAVHYTRWGSFHTGEDPERRCRCVAPLLDAMAPQDGSPGNVHLHALTAKEALEALSTVPMAGCRQRLRTRDASCPHWLLRASKHLVPGEPLVLRLPQRSVS